MDELKQFDIYYTETAARDIDEKMDYIANELMDSRTAMSWYVRLRDTIQKDLSSLPYKFPAYNVEPWKSRGIRSMVTRTDVILYSIDEQTQRVYIRAVCTRGRDLATHLAGDQPTPDDAR